MPQIKVGSVRVPHPFAGRRQVLLPALPLDLHVLSLPLAFILSQDQTLHRIFFIFSTKSLGFSNLSISLTLSYSSVLISLLKRAVNPICL